MPAFNFIIRDALEDDIANCLKLDHSYQTDTVWQMNFQPDNNGWRATFRPERLPRDIDLLYQASEHRLRVALENNSCLVAIGKDEPTLLGYLTLHHDVANQITYIRDIMVSSPFRRAGVGTRLLSVAKRWAHEQKAHFLIAETQTQNFPSIQFCQRHGLAFCGFNDKYFLNHEIAIFFGHSL